MNTISIYNENYEKLPLTPAEVRMKIKTPDHEEGFGLLVVDNADTDATLIIKGGNSIFSAGDVVVPLTQGTFILNLKNTGRYKNVSGEDAGYIVIEIDNPDGIEVCPFEL